LGTVSGSKRFKPLERAHNEHGTPPESYLKKRGPQLGAVHYPKCPSDFIKKYRSQSQTIGLNLPDIGLSDPKNGRFQSHQDDRFRSPTIAFNHGRSLSTSQKPSGYGGSVLVPFSCWASSVPSFVLVLGRIVYSFSGRCFLVPGSLCARSVYVPRPLCSRYGLDMDSFSARSAAQQPPNCPPTNPWKETRFESRSRTERAQNLNGPRAQRLRNENTPTPRTSTQ